MIYRDPIDFYKAATQKLVLQDVLIEELKEENKNNVVYAFLLGVMIGSGLVFCIINALWEIVPK